MCVCVAGGRGGQRNRYMQQLESLTRITQICTLVKFLYVIHFLSFRQQIKQVSDLWTQKQQSCLRLKPNLKLSLSGVPPAQRALCAIRKRWGAALGLTAWWVKLRVHFSSHSTLGLYSTATSDCTARDTHIYPPHSINGIVSNSESGPLGPEQPRVCMKM